MKQLLLTGLILIAFSFFADCQETGFKPSFGVTLDTSKAFGLLNQCSRSTPQNIKSFWTPTMDDIKILESSFQNIKKLTAKECCAKGAKVDSLQGFGFQYLGVIIKGKRYIYINAFPYDDILRYKEHNYDPSTTPVVVCDGGTYYWGALFDPKTKQFSSLAFNGYG